MMKRITMMIIVWLLTVHVAHAETSSQRRALELAKATLANIEAIDKTLRVAVAREDMKLFRERVSIPLDQLQSRWRNAAGATDKDKFTHAGCINAVNELTRIRDTYIFRDPFTKNPADRRAYLREIFREELEQCKDSVRNPALHYVAS